MKIALLEIPSNRPECVQKDFMGGYGWAFHIGPSWRARLIELAKKFGENLPLLDFGYLAAIFRDAGHEVEVVRNQVPEADLVLVHATMVDYRYERRWMKRIREERPGTKIGVVGPFGRFRPDLFLDVADFVVSGEPETVAYEIVDRRMPAGFVRARPIDNLDSLPPPAWEYFPVSEYSYIPALREKPFLPILSSRGCVYSCSYCPYPVNYRWNVRSVENVLDEIGRNMSRFGMKAFLFRDPLFSASKKRAKQIADGITQRGYHVKWACETRLDLLDEDLIDVFYRSGLRVINVGVESADDEVLRQADRTLTARNHEERIVRYCDELGIRVTAFYVLGLPEDSPEKIFHTIEYAKRLNTHAALFSLATPFPGTEYYRQVKDQLLAEDFEKMDCLTPVVRHPCLSPQELRELLERAFVSYYYRPRWFFAFLRRLWRDVFPATLSNGTP